MGLKQRSAAFGPTRALALAGNPNVGKSTVFNALTKLKQHTGNWPGKTVGSAEGICRHRGADVRLVDTPGAYSLCAHSAEEEVARDCLCFGDADAVIVVCDATALARSLHFALQILECVRHVVVCVNLMDEAEKRGLRIDLGRLGRMLGVPCVGVSARSRRGLNALMDAACREASSLAPIPIARVRYPAPLEDALLPLADVVQLRLGDAFLSRAAAVRLLCGDDGYLGGLERLHAVPLRTDGTVRAALAAARTHALSALGRNSDALYAETGRESGPEPPAPCADAPGASFAPEDAAPVSDAASTGARLREAVATALYARAEAICDACVSAGSDAAVRRQLRIDRILTGRWTGLPVMLLGLALILYLTIAGANVPSSFLMRLLFSVQDVLYAFFVRIGAPEWFSGALVLGAYRTLAWVVSVMLPPMAIFFPLFTLLEDLGYLPRVAFNLDHCFCRCRACGKQSLTMWVVDKRMRGEK